MGPVQAPKQNNSKPPDGVQMVKSDIGGLKCPWYLVRGEMVWSKKEGWKSYYEGNRDDCYFKSAEEAIEGGKIQGSKRGGFLPFTTSKLVRTSRDSSIHGRSGSEDHSLTNYEGEFITALEGGIRRWEVLALYFDQKVPDVEIHGLPKMSGREFARNLRMKSNQFRRLIERIRNG